MAMFEEDDENNILNQIQNDQFSSSVDSDKKTFKVPRKQKLALNLERTAAEIVCDSDGSPRIADAQLLSVSKEVDNHTLYCEEAFSPGTKVTIKVPGEKPIKAIITACAKQEASTRIISTNPVNGYRITVKVSA